MCCDRYELLQITSFTNDMIKNPLLIYVIEISSSSRAVQGEMLLRKDSTVSHKQSTLEPSEDRVLERNLSALLFRSFHYDIQTRSQGHFSYAILVNARPSVVLLYLVNSQAYSLSTNHKFIVVVLGAHIVS